VTAITEREQARCRAAEIDHDQKESGECVDAEMRTEPRQTEGQAYGASGTAEQHI
jgi:hypothetical protein